MANTLILKKSSVAAKVPLATDLQVGELAVNLADAKLYSKNVGGTVIQLGGTGTVTSVSGTGTASGLTLSGTVTSSGSLTLSGTVNAVSAGADQAIVNQNNGNATAWYGRILSKNSTSDKAAFLGTYASIAGVFSHNNALNAWADLYVNTVDGSGGGAVRMPSSVFINGNQAIHAGNYNSYAPTLTGTGASGTWGISVTGNAATATSAGNLTGGNLTNDYQVTQTKGLRFGATNQTDANDGYIAAGKFASGLNIVGTQTTAGTGRQVRVWGSLISDAGTSYVLNSGTWAISITGNAATVTNGVVTTGSYADPAWITSLAYGKLTGAPTLPSGAIVGTTDAQTLTSKTLTDPEIVGTIREGRFTIVDGASVDIDPANGSLQSWTLGANRTPTAANWLAGESVTLMILDGSAFTIDWTTIGVTWVGGSAPTLDTTGWTVIQLWKRGSNVYGALVGSVA